MSCRLIGVVTTIIAFQLGARTHCCAQEQAARELTDIVAPEQPSPSNPSAEAIENNPNGSFNSGPRGTWNVPPSTPSTTSRQAPSMPLSSQPAVNNDPEASAGSPALSASIASPDTSNRTLIAAAIDPNSPAFRKAVEDYIQMSAQTTWRCISLLAYALVIVSGTIYMTVRGSFNQLNAFKLIALTLVVTSGLVLIVAGFSSDQITSMMGLLGTVAGYVLGKGESSEEAVKPATAGSGTAALP